MQPGKFKKARTWRGLAFGLGLAFLSAIQAAQNPDGGPDASLSPPLIEVVSFGVAPVAGIETGNGLGPKPGDIVYRRGEIPVTEDDRIAMEGRVRVGETWPSLLDRLGIPQPVAFAKQVPLLPALVPGKYLRAYLEDRERPAIVEYVVSNQEAYTITLRSGAVQVSPHSSDPRLTDRIRADASKASLFTATDAMGLPDALVLQLVEIFAGEVDFHRELHHGYRCTLVYEVFYRDGYIDRPGRILAAEFVIRDRSLQAYFFAGGTGKPGYFSEAGRNLKKIFRRSPVEFSRVTSEYTLARFHPILGVWRAHRGTDYAAPVGTPVLATSGGVVEFAGYRGEFGNLLILRHFDRYQTYYGHLEGFAPGIAAGVAVEQGQVVGFVGVTGLTTGPHLHYEYRVRDGSGDWVSVPEPDLREAPSVSSPHFFRAVSDYREKLSVAARAHVVTLD